MESLDTETRPLLFKTGKKVTAVAVGDPSLTIIEARDALGILLADSCYDSEEGARLHLEQVTWVRTPYEEGTSTFLSFREVMLYRHPGGRFVAQDEDSERFFPCPGAEPYAVVFISKQQFDRWLRQIQKEAVEDLLKAVKPVIRKIPRFSFNGNVLSVPRPYANIPAGRFEFPMVQV